MAFGARHSRALVLGASAISFVVMSSSAAFTQALEGEAVTRSPEQKKQKQAKAERQRSGFIGFLISCWQELKKVQWPDRETLIQATAVTVLFVAVAAAYLGALDAAFNWLIKQIL